VIPFDAARSPRVEDAFGRSRFSRSRPLRWTSHYSCGNGGGSAQNISSVGHILDLMPQRLSGSLHCHRVFRLRRCASAGLDREPTNHQFLVVTPSFYLLTAKAVLGMNARAAKVTGDQAPYRPCVHIAPLEGTRSISLPLSNFAYKRGFIRRISKLCTSNPKTSVRSPYLMIKIRKGAFKSTVAFVERISVCR
jgi:hypothetical protein